MYEGRGNHLSPLERTGQRMDKTSAVVIPSPSTLQILKNAFGLGSGEIDGRWQGKVMKREETNG